MSFNFETMGLGGALSGVGATEEHNPLEGGRVPFNINFDTVGNGGSLSGMSGVETSDVMGGARRTKTTGIPGIVPQIGGGQMGSYYGGEIAYGWEIGPRAHRTEGAAIIIPGVSGRGGDAVFPDHFLVTSTTARNANGNVDDTPDPVLQIAARKTLGAQALLNFSKENLDDLSIVSVC